MKHRLIAGAAGLLLCGSALGQAPAGAFYVAGFDTKADYDAWTLVINEAPSDPSTKLMYWAENTGYEKINPASTHSLGIDISKEEESFDGVTFTSPVIDATDKSGLIVGLTGKGITGLGTWAWLFINLDASIEGSDEWTSLVEFRNKEDEDFPPASVEGWNKVKYELPAQFNNTKLRLRLRARCSGFGADFARSIYFDDIYVAQKPAQDARVTAMGPAEVCSFDPVPVTMTILNNGSQNITGFTGWYSVDGGAQVRQNFTCNLAPGDSQVFAFDTKASMPTAGQEYAISGGVELTGDPNTDDNTASATAVNIVTTLPYQPTFTTRNDTGYWYTDQRSSWGLVRGGDGYYWQSGMSMNSEYNDVLFTRPIYIDKAGSQGLYAYVQETRSQGAIVSMQAYLVKDRTEPVNGTLIYENSAINNLGTQVIANFKVPEPGIYYIAFVNNTTTTNARAGLGIFNPGIGEAINYDLAAGEITAPAPNEMEYGEQETVTVKIQNNGAMKAEGATITLSIDGNEAATESLPAIESEAGIDYTFTQKFNLSGNSHTLKAQINFAQDEMADNNSTSLTITPKIVAPPYEATLYDNDYATDWSWEDVNKDGTTFEVAELYGNNRIVYNDGDKPVECATVDDILYSRPIKLRKGKLYRWTSRPIIGGESGKDFYTCSFDLYKVNGDKKELVKNFDKKEITGNNQYHYAVSVDEDAQYIFGLHFTKDTPSNYYIRFQEMSVVEAANVDIAADRVYLSGKTISGKHDIYAKVRVQNNGLTPISKFTVKFSSPTLGSVSEDFTLEEPIAIKSFYTVRMSNMLSLPITEDEELVCEVTTEGDGIADNNTVTAPLKSQVPLEVPASMPTTANNAWVLLDHTNNEGVTEGYYDNIEFNWNKSETRNEAWTPAVALKAGKKYVFDYTFESKYFNAGDKVVDVYLVNNADGARTKVNELTHHSVNYGEPKPAVKFYATVPADGSYSVLFVDVPHPEIVPTASYTSPETYLYAVNVNEAEALPDVKLVAFTAPAEANVFGESESVKVSYKNAGSVDVVPAIFTLKAGDKEYTAYLDEGVAASAEGEVEFTGVDLSVPGDIALEASTCFGSDAVPADNTLTSTIKSLPVIEASVVSIDGPRSGDLGKNEHLVVTLGNNGKGALKDFPVSYTITREGAQPVNVTETVPGPIADGETLQYTFTANADFSVEGTYSIEVKVDLEGDTDTENNTATTKISSTHKDMDAGVDKITGPTNKLMTDKEYLVISVKNYGESDLYDIPVEASIERDGETVGTFTGIVPEIEAGKSVDYTFATAVDLRQGGTYTVKAATTLDRDVNKDNDAFEGTIYANMIDCGVEAIVNPAATCEAGDQAITVRIKNFGDEPVSDIPVLFKLGTNPQSGLYNGTIAPGESAEYTFPNTYKFRDGREYTLTAYTELESDMDNSNDSCELAIKASGIDGVYADGVSVSAGQGVIIVKSDADAAVSVYEASGKLAGEENLNGGQAKVYVGSGIYLVKVAGEGLNAVRKVVVK